MGTVIDQAMQFHDTGITRGHRGKPPKYKHQFLMSQHDYATLASKFEAYLASHQPYGSPDSLYKPIRYINELGGKRIRPVLLLMAYNLWHDDITPALPAALAVEYFHNFSLMHDDIMDEAPLRRGKKTVHTLYGRNSAILSGDAMLIRCFDLLIEAGRQNEIGVDLCSVMCKVSLEICEGQQMDMDFEARASPTEPEYLEMIRKKTACLLGASLQMGAILAGANQQDEVLLYNFGESMGLGFQIQDDFLDVFGDASLTGKQKGGDILRGKKNFLYVHTFSSLAPPDQKEFVKAYGIASVDQDPGPILQVYDKLSVANYTQRIQASYVERGLADLDGLKQKGIHPLKSLAESLMSRSY
jgi:geranylgeranyl diphosphate synthase type II